VAEKVIKQHHGHKPTFTADEVMTRFPSPQAALDTALKLQQELVPLLAKSNLAVGIGLHTGEIIEGLMGSDTTRKYDIIGDAVNTTKRLESAAGRGEIVVSETTYRALNRVLNAVETRTLQVKGKSDSLQVFAIKTQP
jgi:class 3 adenylate cyclase